MASETVVYTLRAQDEIIRNVMLGAELARPLLTIFGNVRIAGGHVLKSAVSEPLPGDWNKSDIDYWVHTNRAVSLKEFIQLLIEQLPGYMHVFNIETIGNTASIKIIFSSDTVVHNVIFYNGPDENVPNSFDLDCVRASYNVGTGQLNLTDFFQEAVRTGASMAPGRVRTRRENSFQERRCIDRIYKYQERGFKYHGTIPRKPSLTMMYVSTVRKRPVLRMSSTVTEFITNDLVVKPMSPDSPFDYHEDIANHI